MRPLVENEPASCPEPRSSIIARIDHREEKSERHVILVRFFFSTLRKKFLLSIERDNKSIQKVSFHVLCSKAEKFFFFHSVLYAPILRFFPYLVYNPFRVITVLMSSGSQSKQMFHDTSENRLKAFLLRRLAFVTRLALASIFVLAF